MNRAVAPEEKRKDLTQYS